MKLKTSELTGRALDYAVLRVKLDGLIGNTLIGACINGGYSPSTDWKLCGQLIERYLDDLTHMGCLGSHWVASLRTSTTDNFPFHKVGTGVTPQVAICRAVVSAQLGDEVEIPDELLEGK
ncbi:DUF2591 family protein [Xenorhabdus sp. 18]|uniref:phage protein NinX family protein n=1 Tax=Xenorhabdus doucetiae TaxID=351671 RepID=UPI00198BCFC4|nr:phage protein NinX family protein [Xenorhabdus sp. 18]MBD2797706.1 DUF2591 family protein [Xenorhabdus sp. 18]